jgi:hypothetical protein
MKKILIASLFGLLACNTKSEKIECWQGNYQPLGFNFKASLDKLEKKLIEQRIVVGNSTVCGICQAITKQRHYFI